MGMERPKVLATLNYFHVVILYNIYLCKLLPFFRFEVDMNPYSRAAKILAASAGLSKMPPERDTLNNNEIQCILDVMHQHIEPTGNFADSLRPVAVLSPSKVPNNEGKLKLLKFI